MAKRVNVSFKKTDRDKLIRAEIERHSDYSGFLKDLVWEKMQQFKSVYIKSDSDFDDSDGILEILK
jgi:hypothetical protein